MDKIAIIGSREFANPEKVQSYIADLPVDTTIVSGGARGVDSWAESAARARNMQLIIHKPDYKRYGKAAPVLRNQLIVDAADRVVAFWDGKSKGTQDSIERARKSGKQVDIIYGGHQKESRATFTF